MVAKSYQELTQLCEPYLKNGKKYVKVLTKKGAEKEVRWYDEGSAEARRIEKESGKAGKVITFSQKGVLGFNHTGYIYRILNYKDYTEKELASRGARNCVYWEWYLIPTFEIGDFKVEKIFWEDVCDETGNIVDKSRLN